MANRWNEARDAIESLDEARAVAAQAYDAYRAAQAAHVHAQNELAAAEQRVRDFLDLRASA